MQRGEPTEDETTRWSQEIIEEESRRKPSEPARPTLTKSDLNGDVQKWLVDGSEYKGPHVSLHDIESDVKDIVDNVNGSKKVNTNLICVLEKEDMKTGDKETDTFGAKSKTHTVTVQLGDTYGEMRDKMF